MYNLRVNFRKSLSAIAGFLFVFGSLFQASAGKPLAGEETGPQILAKKNLGKANSREVTLFDNGLLILDSDVIDADSYEKIKLFISTGYSFETQKVNDNVFHMKFTDKFFSGHIEEAKKNGLLTIYMLTEIRGVTYVGATKEALDRISTKPKEDIVIPKCETEDDLPVYARMIVQFDVEKMGVKKVNTFENYILSSMVFESTTLGSGFVMSLIKPLDQLSEDEAREAYNLLCHLFGEFGVRVFNDLPDGPVGRLSASN